MCVCFVSACVSTIYASSSPGSTSSRLHPVPSRPIPCTVMTQVVFRFLLRKSMEGPSLLSPGGPHAQLHDGTPGLGGTLELPNRAHSIALPLPSDTSCHTPKRSTHLKGDGA